MQKYTDINGTQVFAGDFMKRINGSADKPSTQRPHWLDFEIVGNIIDNPEMHKDFGVTEENKATLLANREAEMEYFKSGNPYTRINGVSIAPEVSN